MGKFGSAARVLAGAGGARGYVQPARWIRNTLFAVILLLIVASLDRAGLPMTQRVEEYIAFVLTTDFTHEGLSEQMQHVGNLASGLSLTEVLSGAVNRLRQAVPNGAAPVDGPLSGVEEAGASGGR